MSVPSPLTPNPDAPPRADAPAAVPTTRAITPFPRALRLAITFAAGFGLLSGCGQSLEAAPLAARYMSLPLVATAVALASTRERGSEGALLGAAMGAVFAIDRAARRSVESPVVCTRRAYLLAAALPLGYVLFCVSAAVSASAVLSIGFGLSARELFDGFRGGARIDDWALGFGTSAVNAVLVVPLVIKAAPAIANRARGLLAKMLAAFAVAVAVRVVQVVLTRLLFG